MRINETTEEPQIGRTEEVEVTDETKGPSTPPLRGCAQDACSVDEGDGLDAGDFEAFAAAEISPA